MDAMRRIELREVAMNIDRDAVPVAALFHQAGRPENAGVIECLLVDVPAQPDRPGPVVRGIGRRILSFSKLGISRSTVPSASFQAVACASGRLYGSCLSRA
jgi:hypothetical protein